MTDIVVARIMDDLNALAKFGTSPAGGVDRTTYSDSYRGGRMAVGALP